ncbi:MAG TPA: glycosyltransferase family 4 protein, partial [Chitinophagales bacterium]
MIAYTCTMRILQLASKMPYQPKDGGALGIHIFTEGLLQAGNEVKVVAVNSLKLFTPLSEIDETYRAKTNFEAVEIDTRVKPFAAFLNLFTNKSYNISRFESQAMTRKLEEIFAKQDFDIVQLESVFMSPYVDVIRKHSKAKIVLRAHNIEYKIWERLSANEKNPFKKGYLNLLAKRLKKYELSMLNRYDGITYITPDEGKEFQTLDCKIPLCYIPFALNIHSLKTNKINVIKNSVFSLAAMDWQPNLEGVQWFLDEVWNKVLQQIPDAKFYVAGRNMNREWLDKKYPNVEMIGEVKDAKSFIESKAVMIVPLFSGGGVRVKIIEGFANGKAIVSTKIGAEGIAYENGKHLCEANDVNDFANAIVSLLRDENLRKTLETNGRKLAEEQYDIQAVSKKLTEFYQSLIDGKK